VTASDETARRSARRLASEILVKVDTRKAYADVLLDQTLRGADLDPADRALLTELVYGTLRWRGALDGRLQRQLRRPLGETDPRIRNLLRLTCYQLFYLDRIPSYAAVNEAVELAKSYGGRKAASFVNGVLRNLLRESESIPVDGSAASLAIQYSHPEWLVRRWLAEFGADEAGALMRADNERAPLALRVNSLKCDREQ
jgi:16S rRNA (cytosine967-C5)-methyltransferase